MDFVSDLGDDELRARLENKGWVPRAIDLAIRNRDEPAMRAMLQRNIAAGTQPTEDDFE